jgi:hypothetical protein
MDHPTPFVDLDTHSVSEVIRFLTDAALTHSQLEAVPSKGMALWAMREFHIVHLWIHTHSNSGEGDLDEHRQGLQEYENAIVDYFCGDAEKASAFIRHAAQKMKRQFQTSDP